MPYCAKCGAQLPEGSAYCPNCGAPTAPAEPSRPESRLVLASWVERFVAYLLDAIIVSVVLMVLSGGLMMPLFWQSFWPHSIILFLYWTFMEGLYGQSLGKMIMNLKVTHLNGGAPDIAHAAIESLGKAFFPLLLIDCIIGWILYPSKRQRLFNYVSETVVVRAHR